MFAVLVGVEGGIGAENLLRWHWRSLRQPKKPSRHCESKPLHDASSGMATKRVADAEKKVR
jgi:hypothetical protein